MRRSPARIATARGRLRRGLAQTLALLGRAHRPVPVGGSAGADQARLVTRELFDHANADSTYIAWASLHDVLSLLAEAAPEEFLRAMRDGLQGEEPLHARMFTEYGDDGLGSAASPHTAFLWALETVAWSPEHFDDAVDVLARLAALDPGGRLSNRPARSLAEVLSIWHPETAANEEQRHRALRRLHRDEPDVARRLPARPRPGRARLPDRAPRAAVPDVEEAGRRQPRGPSAQKCVCRRPPPGRPRRRPGPPSRTDRQGR